MSATFYIIIPFWAFFTGFLLGLTFDFRKKRPISVTRQTGINENNDFSIINEEYRNFLNYDGSKQ